MSARDEHFMQAICDDLRAECAELQSLLESLGNDRGWTLQTKFHGWTAWDEIAHLHLFDQLALLAIEDRERFLTERRRLEGELARGKQISGIARERLGHFTGSALASAWRNEWITLVERLRGLEPKARLPWFGPDMSARSFATARLMETWAHGQDVWDALRLPRPPTSRLAQIAQLGVLTFGWSFINRGLTPPAVIPAVKLDAPDGSPWTWGDASSDEFIRGSALDFCLVVTQRRHVQDTSLEVRGTTAEHWMSIAQCFAGPAADGPPAGSFRR